jgi:hypothetical protein
LFDDSTGQADRAQLNHYLFALEFYEKYKCRALQHQDITSWSLTSMASDLQHKSYYVGGVMKYAKLLKACARFHSNAAGRRICAFAAVETATKVAICEL